MPVDILQEIPVNIIGYFCNNVLKRDWPNSIHVYYFIKTMTEWKKNNADVRVSLLCADGNIEDGTFVGILYSELGGCTVLAYTQEDSCARLGKALRETRRIKWSEPLMFEAVLQKHSETIHAAAEYRELETQIYSQSNILYMPSDLSKKLRFECKGDVYVAPLKQSHLPYIHSVWAHNDRYTLRELQTTLRLNGGFGVFSSAGDQLLCWALHTHYGGVGTLQTRTGEGGKGYARLVVNCISQALGTMGVSPHVCVMDSNLRSLSLFRSVGYQHVSSIQYITTHDSSSSSDTYFSSP